MLPNAQFVGQLPDRDKLYYDIIYNHGLAALRGDESIPDALQAMETEANETFDDSTWQVSVCPSDGRDAEAAWRARR